MKELGKSIGQIEHKQIGNEERFVMHYPVGFKSADGKVSGKIDFGLFVKFERDGPTPKNFSLGFMEQSEILSFDCNHGDLELTWCDNVRHFLKHNFVKEVLTFDQPDESPFDQPFSARQLLGLLRYLKDFPEQEFEQLRALNSPEKQTLFLFFNCHQASIRSILGKEARADLTKLSFA